VLRGGSWATSGEWFARCAFRNFAHPAGFNVNFGFRLVVGSPSPPPNF
jgi:formylglycine-generating enzyme required for sulfatase activity